MNRIFLICTIALLPSAITSACITPTPTCPIQPWGEFSITPATSWQAASGQPRMAWPCDGPDV